MRGFVIGVVVNLHVKTVFAFLDVVLAAVVDELVIFGVNFRLKRNAFAAVALVIMFSQTYSFAQTWNVALSQGVKTDVSWSDSVDSDAVTYFKIKPTKTGYITFSILSDDYSGYAALCNSSKKVISKGKSSSDGDWIWGGSSYAYYKKLNYGVKKGKTYYLKIKGYPYNKNSEGKYYATVKWTNTKVKPAKYGTKKSKAKAIKRKKTIKGLFIAGNRKAQWYKITTNKKKATFTLKGAKTNDAAKISVIYRSNATSGKWMTLGPGSASREGYVSKPYLTQYLSKKKYTAYVNITPNGKTSGMYTLRWK